MTRVEVRIDRLVLRDVRADLAAGFGPRVEARIAELAAEMPLRSVGRDPAEHPAHRDADITGRDDLVDLVARRIWTAARKEAGAT